MPRSAPPAVPAIAVASAVAATPHSGLPPRTLAEGALCALGAGLAWGLVFIVPLLLGDYPPAVLSFGRYTAFGTIAVVLGLRDTTRLRLLDRADWLRALELALSGNILYYLCLSAAIQLADAPLPTVIIGTLPIIIAIISNLRDRRLPWARLVPPLAAIATGVLLVNRHEIARLGFDRPLSDYLTGVALAWGAVACWTWYPLRNSQWLARRPHLGSGLWATAQGLATLPLALLGMAGACAWYALAGGGSGGFVAPLGPRPWTFVGLMFTLGLLASWLGTTLWNRASRLLPAGLAGQLMVCETLAALTYAYCWRGQAPDAGSLGGVALLMAGLLLGLRAFRRGR
ncbi:DMT family transporter [Nitratidesulfovibrio termitidis]|uniref:DMT family transporter n=1 Tax=Nitratidesulfovibrio termitidis TaxID=42252 RepID=UPI00041267F6|nr:DMT family transporter [Nitratidesulfovibrio termitidis]